MPLYVFSYIKHTTIQYQAKFNNSNLNEIGGETTYITPLTYIYGNCFNTVTIILCWIQCNLEFQCCDLFYIVLHVNLNLF